MDFVTKEVSDVEAPQGRQPPARTTPAFEAPCDSAAGQPPDGGLDRHGGLDRDGGARGEDPREEGQERGRPAAETVNKKLGKALAAACEGGRKLRGHAVVARRKLGELHETMTKLVPQIRYWLRTGYVAAGK
ncbi:MAG TPA: hypothetical protein VMT03_21220, partial [Polyangia bacterium]|nr:hypothetical protein [Polyangia bacterium]